MASGAREPAATPPFIGRERELGELAAGLDAAVGGHGSFYLVTGEPGIGKTRLIDEFTREATTRGARVFRGRCVEDGGAPPYWPWIQVLRSCLGNCPADLARAGTSLLAVIAPESGMDPLPVDAELVAPDSEAAR